jgi:hypothetical protein
MCEDVPEASGGFVLLSLVSMYASDNGLLRQVTTGSMVKAGLNAKASGRIYPVATSTDCWNKSCSRTMKPVSIVVALPRICCQLVST